MIEDTIMMDALMNIPIKPVNIVYYIKKAMERDSSLTLETFAERSNKDLKYYYHLFEIEKIFAEGLQNFMKKNKLSIRETSEFLKISEEDIERYMAIL